LNFFIIYAVLASLVVIITVIGLKSSYFNLIIIFILAWTGESLIGYGLVPDHIPNLLFIYIIMIMFVKALMPGSKGKYNFYTPGLAIILLFISICFLSAIINSIDYLRTIFFMRHFILFYMFFLCILNSDLKEREIKRLNKFLIFLLVIQIPVATIKWLIIPHPGEFGQESFTGSYAVHGGVLHVLIPLIAIGFIIPMYINKKRKIFILLFSGFIWFSLIGAKRALFFVLPLFILCILYLISHKFQFKFKISKIVTIMVLMATVIYVGIRLSHTLNPEGRVGGSFSLKYVINYFINYTTGRDFLMDGDQYATGRYAATTTMVKYLTDSKIENFLLGYGPGIALKSGLIEDNYRSTFLSFGIEDGITGFVWLSAQIGIIGTISLLYLLFYLFKKVLDVYKRQNTVYWKIFLVGTLGAFIVFFFDILHYSDDFLRQEALLSIFYYFVAVSLISGKITKKKSPLENA